MPIRGLAGAVVAGVALLGSPSGQAQDASSCVTIEAAAERLECYDRAFGRTAEDRTSASAPLEDFGHEHIRAPRDNEPAGAMSATIERLQETPQGLYLFWLDNGQMWRQTESSDAVHFKVGDTIAIKRGALGSYRLHKTQGGRAVPVKRLQ